MKVLKAIYGLILMLFGLKNFNAKRILKNKRVAIVGPADSAYEAENAAYIDSFDYVIRINKAIVNWKPENEKYIGTKTDILLHNFLENEKTGGGILDFELFEKYGIKYVLNPIPIYFGFRNIFNFYKKYSKSYKTYIGYKPVYKKYIERFKPQRPTTGFSGLMMVLESDFKEFFITGITFFKTPYKEGYRDQLNDLKANEDHMKKENLHLPDVEFDVFLDFLNSHKKKIIVDQKLYDILKCHNMHQRVSVQKFLDSHE